MVRRPVIFGALLAIGAAVACFPPPLDETGLLCDDTRPCDTGYLCFDGVCGRIGEIDAGPDNWIHNPSFEDLNDAGNFPLGWQRSGGGQVTLFADNAQSHTGLHSARLSSSDGGNPQVLTNPAPVLGTLPRQTWCARAFVKSNTDDGGIAATLFIRERDDAGVTIHDYASQRVVTTSQDWLQIGTSANTVGAARLDVRVGVNGRAVPGQFMWVDDVQLKRSIDGTCDWMP